MFIIGTGVIMKIIMIMAYHTDMVVVVVVVDGCGSCDDDNG